MDIFLPSIKYFDKTVQLMQSVQPVFYIHMCQERGDEARLTGSGGPVSFVIAQFERCGLHAWNFSSY